MLLILAIIKFYLSIFELSVANIPSRKKRDSVLQSILAIFMYVCAQYAHCLLYYIRIVGNFCGGGGGGLFFVIFMTAPTVMKFKPMKICHSR